MDWPGSDHHFSCRRRGDELFGSRGEGDLEPRIGEADVLLIWILPMHCVFRRFPYTQSGVLGHGVGGHVAADASRAYP